MRLLEKISDFQNECYKYGACFCLVIVIAASFLQVFTRYVLNNSLSWTEELARYIFIWMTMLAAPVALRKGMHASVNILEKFFKGNGLVAYQCLIHLFIIIAALLMITQGIKMMDVSMGKPSTVMRISMHYIYMAIPMGGFGLLIQALYKMFILFRQPDKDTA